ncbi:8873_t:CDS:2 [Dentiscutata erythropus]|uniref:8873_t:CDS:1 n=1 Tax=Dentiscutata erythropus TaxID=1348616 RepID=A0A9N9P955_9GLOM|nr:8873_t:CDS:2 [Dentiscutata erythropus]
MTTSSLYSCGFCSKTYIHKGSLKTHETSKHKNNRFLHNQYPLYIPLFSDCQQFCSTFINLVQKRLTSHRSTQGLKLIEFPCLQGYQRIAKLFNFEEWGKTIDKTGTETYVVFNQVNLNNNTIEEKETKFCWKEKGKIFKYGIITFIFEINTETIEIVDE